MSCSGAGTGCSLSVSVASADVTCSDGADCTIDVSGLSNAAPIRCQRGSTCNVNCGSVANCTVLCDETSDCTLDCMGLTGCILACDDGGARRCPSGLWTCADFCP